MSKIQVTRGENLSITKLNRDALGSEKEILNIDGDSGNVSIKNNAGNNVFAVNFSTGSVSLNGQELSPDNDINIYVNAATGSDVNPGTQSQPLATMDAALEKLSTNWRKSAVINVSAHTYEFSGNAMWLGSPIGPESSPLQIIGTAVDCGLGEMTMQAPLTSTSVAAATGATVTDAYRGMYLRNISTGGRILIARNSFAAGVTTFELVKNDDSFDVNVGDTFVVEYPGTVFQAPMFGPVDIHASGETAFGIKNVKFQAHPDSFLGFIPLAVLFGFNFFEGCWFDGGATSRPAYCLHGTRWNAVGTGFVYWGNAPENPFSSARAYAGFYAKDTAISVGERSSCDMALVADNIYIDCGLQSNFAIWSCDFDESTVFLGDNSTGSIYEGKIANATNLGSGAIDVFSLAKISLGTTNGGLVISDSAVSAIYIRDLSQVRAGNVSGSGNVGYGIEINYGGLARTDQFSQTTSVTGTIANLLVGAVTKAYGDLPFGETNASGPTLNRAE